MNLPQTVGVWTRPDKPEVYSAKTIFEYMNGAGELYIGYRFEKVECLTYVSNGPVEILVELYWMESSDEPYGLLSQDWGGDATVLGAQPDEEPRDLYGAGLLRIARDNLYARIMASRETEASKQAVIELGQAIVSGRSHADQPAVMGALPTEFPGADDTRYELRRDRSRFVRNQIVLNAAYFLSYENILGLDLSTDVAYGEYPATPPTDGTSKPVRLLLVRYTDAEKASEGLASFRTAYLPETAGNEETPGDGAIQITKIEDGWVGVSQFGRCAALVFECSEETVARAAIRAAGEELKRLEKEHG